MSGRKAKGDSPASKPLKVATRLGEPVERMKARAFLRPSVNKAVTMQKVLKRDFGETGLTELLDELSDQCRAATNGNVDRPEALLTAQAHTLNALFNDLSRLAFRNWDNLGVAGRLLRLAFMAQSQSRATLEAVGTLKNPGVVIARQANIAHGPQ